MHELEYSRLFDKILAGWLGKSIGGAIGAPVENHKRFARAKSADIWPDRIMPNDDLDIQLVWLEAFQERGMFLTSRDLEEMWFDRCEYNFCEYGVFMNNAERGIHAPLSGDWNNDFFRESEGCPIRSEIWGMACPGNPRLAAEYAKLDGELDHAGFSVEAEQFLSAAAAAAFTCDSLTETLEAALAALPRDSRAEQVLRHLQALCTQPVNDAILWRRIMRTYGDRDASKAITNFAIVLAALLRHGGSFEECMTFCYNAGWDTDCTAATAGALLGILHGSACLPEEWVRKIGTDLCAGISVKHRTAPFSVISEDTARVAVEMAATRNPAIRILNAPEIPVRPEPRRTVEFDVDYPEGPVIRPDRPTPVEVRIRNVSGKPLSGIIRLTPEPALDGSGLTFEFNLAAGDGKRFRTEFRRTGSGALPDRFPVGVAVEDAGRNPLLRSSFGFGGARVWQVYGPYWDMWDKTANESCPYAGCNPYAVGYGRDSYNQYADLRREYLDEARLLSGEIPEEDPFVLLSGTDRITERDLGGFKGQACYYLVREIEMPTPRPGGFILARSGPCELYLDGILLKRFSDTIQYAAGGEEVGCQFTGKKQRLVVKAIRPTDSFSFGLLTKIGAGMCNQSLYSSELANYCF